MTNATEHDQYIEMTMHFKCNLKCVHCMIEGTMDRLVPESDARFREVLEHNRRTNRWTGLILTGAEITLRRDLPDLARSARAHGFRRVRIQTHGVRLADRSYCEELIDAGVNEFFVSVCAADAATHDAITQAPGSFEKTMRGLEHLDRFDEVATYTNTVLTRLSRHAPPDVVDLVSGLRRLARMEFWNYWPMRETDDKRLLSPLSEIVPPLREAIARARRRGIAVEVKNVPECLLGDDRDVLVNDQPRLVIDPAFWDEFERNGFHECVHRERCGSVRCLGLNAAYADRFGWEPTLLSPIEA